MKSKNILSKDISKSKEIKNIQIEEGKDINNISIPKESNKIINNNSNIYNKNNIINKYNNDINDKESNDEKIYVIINKNTEKLMNSKNKTDLIQCALEYNSYLIENIIKEKDNINKVEYDNALNRLYHNLNVLSESFELYENKYKLINNKGSNNKENNNDNKNKKEKNKNKIKKEDNDINHIERRYSNSITNIKMELPL